MSATVIDAVGTPPPEPGDAAPQQGAWARFRGNRLGVTGAAMLLIALAVALLAPVLAPHDPYASTAVTIDDIYQPPTPSHLLGTDDGGKDVLSALLYGARVSLLVGFTAATISLIVGGVVGLVAGYRGGRVDTLLMRVTDVFLVLPVLALQIVIVAVVGQSLRNIILVIGLLGWTTTARLVRSQTLTIKQRRFVTRARALGAGDGYIVRRHVFPLVLPLMLANTVLVISLSILEESTLAFIGLGDPTVVSWGQMLNFAFTRGAVSARAWWALLPPGFALVWVVLGTTLLGTALEAIFNPRLRRHFLEPEPADARIAVPPRAPDDDPPLLRVRHLSVAFDTAAGPARAVDDVSFDLARGETLGLVGESGCGKTTTVLAALRLLPPGGRVTAGEVLLDGTDVLGLSSADIRDLRWRRMAIVFQGAMNALNPVRTVSAQIAEAVRLHDRGASRQAAAARASDLLDAVGIPRARATDYPHTYSGGMRQRAMIALALACEPEVIVADEPTTALDVMVQAQILELLVSLVRDLDMAMILVTHDLGVVASTCDRVAVMYGGTLAEDGPVGRVFADPRHPYTRLLLDAFPDIDAPERTIHGIPGVPPRLTDLPAGCRFHPRCPQVMDRCRGERPPLYRVGGAPAPPAAARAAPGAAGDLAGAQHVSACFLHDGAPVARQVSDHG